MRLSSKYHQINLPILSFDQATKSIPCNTMAPPSQLSIATSSVQRLVKEEASYYKELQQQEARLEKTQASKDEDENAEYQVKQEASTRRFHAREPLFFCILI